MDKLPRIHPRFAGSAYGTAAIATFGPLLATTKPDDSIVASSLQCVLPILAALGDYPARAALERERMSQAALNAPAPSRSQAGRYRLA